MGHGDVELGAALRVVLRKRSIFSSDPVLNLPLIVLPPRSRVAVSSGALVIGSERVRSLASAIRAHHRGFDVQGSQLFVTRRGAVTVSMRDAVEATMTGTVLRLEHPPLGVNMHTTGIGLWGSSGAKEALGGSFEGLVNFHIKQLDEQEPLHGAIVDYVHRMTSTISRATRLDITDHSIEWFWRYTGDEVAFAIDVAHRVVAFGDKLDTLLGTVPCRQLFAPIAQAYRALAEVSLALQRPLPEGAPVYVPAQPALLGWHRGARVVGGEIRTYAFSLRSGLNDERGAAAGGLFTTLAFNATDHSFGSSAQVALAGSAPGAGASAAHLSAAGDLASIMRAVMQVFPEVHYVSDSELGLSRPGGPPSPTDMRNAMDALCSWALATRGERTHDSAYR
jgi:hypothetical protein